MNEFMGQFLLECRELVAQATDDLLALEEQPEQRERLDGAFRAFHTLKGAAGIVEFHAMGRALHAAEDVLAAVRKGAQPVTPQVIGDSLTCLDQVVQWLDAMEGNGDIPPGAEAQADDIVARFGRAEPSAPPRAETRGEAAPDWLAGLKARRPDVVTEAVSALRYTPDPQSFYRGEDPLAQVSGAPGLLALELVPAGPWPRLDELDPFACQLSFMALSSAPGDEVRAHLARLSGQVEVQEIAGSGGSRLPQPARELLEAQALLLADPSAEVTPGRTGSARRVAAAVLRRIGRGDEAEHIAAVDSANLPGALDALLAERLMTEAPGLDGSPTAESRPLQEPLARTLRVDVERIDRLVNLTGELMVAKNAAGHAARLAETGESSANMAGVLKAQHAQLERLVSELQRSVLQIRVLPLRHVFQRFPRLVREMVVALGKPAHLVTEGDTTEADKAVVESLFEPLLHVIRNALDHGIETPQARALSGKPPAATIHLRAARRGDQVLVEVEDDGGGVDLARVRAIAAERAVASADALAAMNDDEVLELIFSPGFSTAEEVTSVSGRGVGMDAVRTAVERLGGRVSLASRAGEGTTVRFTLPFTVMMSRVMTVEAGGQLFGVPLEAVVETVRLSPDRIVEVGAARAFVLRDRTIPLIDLAQALGEPRLERGARDANVVIALAGGRIGGLEVDRLGERMDVMLKPMEGLLTGLPGLAGTTLLGDGRVLLVLDLQELLE